MALQFRSGPAIEPVSLNDTKSFLRIDAADDDILVASLITAARIYIETTIGKILITEQWSYFKDCWPQSGILHLPLSPLKSVDEIRLHQENETFEIISTEDYATDLVSNQPRIKFLKQTNHQTKTSAFNQIEVRFTAGFGDTEEAVPNDLRQALLMLVSHWYEQREPIGLGGTFNEIPTTVSALIANYKSYRMQ